MMEEEILEMEKNKVSVENLQKEKLEMQKRIFYIKNFLLQIKKDFDDNS